jgi:hypothetical protein
VWIGRFDSWPTSRPTDPELVYRRDVKLHHCHSAKAKDANITQALIDRFAPGVPNRGKGTKAEPGWFYGFKADIWAAYALAVYVADTKAEWRDDVMLDRLAGDATFHDPLIAGWWLYGVCCQIGAFSGDGPWMADPVTGRITKQGRPGVSRDLPNLSKDGQGVNRPQLREPGVSRDLPNLSKDGQGVNRPQLREPGVDDGDEFHPVTMPELVRWFRWLAARLRHVRIVNGDWARVVTTGAAHTIPVRMGAGPAGIFLDPPYANNERAGGLYGHGHDDGDITTAVRDWCATNGDNPRNRIVLAGYDTEHAALESHGWTVHEWFTNGYLTGGMGNLDGTSQQHRERLWASPHCLTAELDGQLDLLSLMEAE